MLLSTGSLTHGFFGVPKKEGSKLALRNSICRFRDPVFDRFFGHFFGSKCVEILIFFDGRTSSHVSCCDELLFRYVLIYWLLFMGYVRRV